MLLVAGLGNPGVKYSETRHNVGYRVIEKLAARLQVNMKAGKGPYIEGKTPYVNSKIVLIQPTVFMNNSGEAIQKAASWFKIEPPNCLICYDDLNLDCGDIRIRRSGSAGGHNGIKDIIQKMGSDQFPRLRVGIGSDFREDEQVKYVLSRFNKQQASVIQEAVEKAADAVLKFAKNGIETAMNDYN